MVLEWRKNIEQLLNKYIYQYFFLQDLIDVKNNQWLSWIVNLEINDKIQFPPFIDPNLQDFLNKQKKLLPVNDIITGSNF